MAYVWRCAASPSHLPNFRPLRTCLSAGLPQASNFRPVPSSWEMSGGPAGQLRNLIAQFANR
jgi:hypothetical protein